jgi:membrane associated rhomboid family serine protease
VIALAVAFFYGGSLLAGIIPRLQSHISWEGHLLGALAGAIIAYLLTRTPQPRTKSIENQIDLA